MKKNVVGIENGITDEEYFWISDDEKLFVKQIIIPNSIRFINGNIFTDCVNLEKLVLPDKCKFMATSGLDLTGCVNLVDLKISSGFEITGSVELDVECDLANPVFYNEDKTIALCANYFVNGEIVLDENTKKIQQYAFSECEDLYSIILPRGLEIIESGAFLCCASLQEISIPDGVIFIGYGCFSYCSSLEELKLPASVKNVGSEIASECENLQRIILEGDVKVNNRYVVPKGIYSREDEEFDMFVGDI